MEVVLRDFDGSRTIFPTTLPLKDIISAVQTDLAAVAGKAYVKTEEMDDVFGSARQGLFFPASNFFIVLPALFNKFPLE